MMLRPSFVEATLNGDAMMRAASGVLSWVRAMLSMPRDCYTHVAFRAYLGLTKTV